MNRKPNPRKLSLNRQTVRRLDDAQLGQAAGGTTAFFGTIRPNIDWSAIVNSNICGTLDPLNTSRFEIICVPPKG